MAVGLPSEGEGAGRLDQMMMMMMMCMVMDQAGAQVGRGGEGRAGAQVVACLRAAVASRVGCATYDDPLHVMAATRAWLLGLGMLHVQGLGRAGPGAVLAGVTLVVSSSRGVEGLGL